METGYRRQASANALCRRYWRCGELFYCYRTKAKAVKIPLTKTTTVAIRRISRPKYVSIGKGWACLESRRLARVLLGGRECSGTICEVSFTEVASLTGYSSGGEDCPLELPSELFTNDDPLAPRGRLRFDLPLSCAWRAAIFRDLPEGILETPV